MRSPVAQSDVDNDLTAGPATTYGYDDNGSRTTSTVAAAGSSPAATTSYGFDPEGNLNAATLPGSTPTDISYTSDGDGLRQSRTVGSATADMLWDVSGSLPLLLDDGTHSYIYGPSSVPIAQVDDITGAIQYLHGDLIGSTRQITNSSGTVVGTTSYDAYGNRTDHTGSADSVIGFSGNWTDPTTNLVYLRARDYDPATAQFLTVDLDVDTTGQPYAYVANNPLLSTDDTGLCVGMDGTPQNRQCTQNDFFWAGLLPSIGQQFQKDSAGFNDGLFSGVPLLVSCAVSSFH